MTGMIGQRIGDRYKLLSVVGGGGMAVVYKARDLILDRIVAVKVLRSEFSDDEEFIGRFRREARAVASLAHPNIVNIYDIGDDSDEFYYIVMEYIEGETLKQLIKRQAPLPTGRALKIMDQITAAIAHAHSHYIIHRDIKPQNILMDANGDAKVTDFGIAVAMTSATMTRTNSVIGSAHYFSPEQARGGYADSKSDIYSLGIVLFEMVTAELPFSGTSPISVALKHLQEDIPEPRELNSAIPQSVENVIFKALTKDPRHRYGHVRDMREDMRTALDPDRLHEAKYVIPDDNEETTRVMPVAPMGSGGPPDQDPGHDDVGDVHDPEDGGKKKKKQSKKKKLWWILLIILLLLVGGAAAAFTFIPGWLHVDDVSVPKVVGMDYDKARTVIKDQNLDVESEEATNAKYDKGKVARQNPAPNKQVKEGSPVHITVSTGPKKMTLDNYEGKDKDSVKLLLGDNDFKEVHFIPETNDDYPEGTVFKQDPEPGARVVPSKTKLTLTYSKGAEKAEVPDLAGSTKKEAEDKLHEQGLSTDFQGEEYSDAFGEGKVSSQSPNVGEEVEKGAAIQFKISKGSKPDNDQNNDQGNDQNNTQNNDEDDNQNGNETNDDENQPNAGSQSDPISFTQPVKVEHDDGKDQIKVKIAYSDADHDKKTFKKEQIDETKKYEVPLTVEPDGKIMVWVYTNGDLAKTIKKDYDDVKKETGD